MEASPPAATEAPHARMNRGANRAARRFGQCTYVAVHCGVRADASVCQCVLVRVAVHMSVCACACTCAACALHSMHALSHSLSSLSDPCRPVAVLPAGVCRLFAAATDVCRCAPFSVVRRCQAPARRTSAATAGEGRCPGRPGRADVRRRVRPVRAAEVSRRVGARRVSVREPARRRVPSPTYVGSDVCRAADVCRSAGVYRLR